MRQVISLWTTREVFDEFLNFAYNFIVRAARAVVLQGKRGSRRADLLSSQHLLAKLLLVDQPPPAAKSLQFAQQRSQSAALQLQLMDFFFLSQQVEHVGFTAQTCF